MKLTFKKLLAALLLLPIPVFGADYYGASGDPATGSALSSSVIRAEYSAIATGFTKVAPYTGNANKAVVINAGATGQTVTTGTLALAGNFATTGAFNTTLVQGATTSLTLPLVNGTLATLAGTEELTNKTLNASVGKGTWTASGTWTLPAVTLGAAITYGGVTLSNAVTGTGSMVLSTSPSLTTPALGTPSALVGTNITGTAAGLTAGNVTTNANLTGHVTSVGNAAVLGSFTLAQLNTAVSDADVAQLGTNTFTGAQTLNSASPQLTLGVLNTTSGGILTYGSTSGSQTWKPPAAAGAGVTITFPATTVTLNAAGDLTGTTLAAGVTASSLTSVGTLTSLTLGGALVGPVTATVFNTVSTTINAFGVAAAINFGAASNNDVIINLDSYQDADVTGPTFAGRKARGTAASPTQVIVNDRLLTLYGVGYTSGGIFDTNAVAIILQAAESFTAAAQGTKISFQTTLIGGTSRTEKMLLSDAGIVTMAAYGAGTATFDAGGVISSVSDERLKIKDGVIKDPIPMLMALEPGYFYGKPEAHMGDARQLGFYAQNVRKAIGPEAAPDPLDGRPWGYFDRSVLAVAVESAKNHEARLRALETRQ